MTCNYLRLTLATLVAILLIEIPNPTAQNLKPHNVIIRSSFQKESTLQPFERHSYHLLESVQFHESYVPPLPVKAYPFSEDYALSIKFSGLTKTFGEFSEFFLKERGVLENAYVYYLTGYYKEAEDKLVSLLPTNEPIGEKVRLLLAWTKFKRGQFEAAYSYAKSGFTAGYVPIRDDSLFLGALILYQSQDWTKIITLYQNHQHLFPPEARHSRFSLMYLFALIFEEKWDHAVRYLDETRFRALAHTKPAYKLHEIAGIVYFHNGIFTKSLTHFEQARSHNKVISYQPSIVRAIAWNFYYLKRYKDAINLIDRSRSLDMIEYDDEVKYLKLACQTHQNNWQAVAKLFDTIPEKSVFYNHAAFKIQSQSVSSSIDAGLEEKIKGVRYDFPNMAFETSLYNGNQAFRTGLLKEAETHYLRALATDVETEKYFLAQYNLSLTHLKQKEYAKAKIGHQNLVPICPADVLARLTYHRLYTLYQLENRSQYLDLFDSSDPDGLKPDQKWELDYMRASILLANNMNKDAAKNFLMLWEQERNVSALESAVRALYKEKQFDRILELHLKNPDINSEIFFIYRVKSLLGIKKASEALKAIENSRYQSEAFNELQLEVWMANRQYQTIINQIPKYLQQTLKPDTRIHYYFGLGDAYFNLKQYTDSKNQFYKALGLTKDPVRRSLIQYNIALVTYYTEDYPSFLKETNLMLQNDQLTPDIRYNLTQLLVDYHQQNNQPEKADQILADYIKSNEFQRVKAKLKREQLLYQNGSYDKCYRHARKPDPKENFFQKRDRLVLFGYCGNQIGQSKLVIKQIKGELDASNKDYRINELSYILAQANFNIGQYKNAVALNQKLKKADLDSDAANKRQLLLSESLIKLKQFKKAEAELGDVNHYRQTPYYDKALELHASINSAKGDVDSSVRALFRIYYMPNVPDVEKQISLIKISELLLANHRKKEAKSYFERINPEHLKKEKEWSKRFNDLKSNLN